MYYKKEMISSHNLNLPDLSLYCETPLLFEVGTSSLHLTSQSFCLHEMNDQTSQAWTLLLYFQRIHLVVHYSQVGQLLKKTYQMNEPARQVQQQQILQVSLPMICQKKMFFSNLGLNQRWVWMCHQNLLLHGCMMNKHPGLMNLSLHVLHQQQLKLSKLPDWTI